MYEVEDGQKVRWAVKVVTKSSLKTKKAKTKVCSVIFCLICDFELGMYSYMPRLKYTAPLSIRISCASGSVLKIMIMFT